MAAHVDVPTVESDIINAAAGVADEVVNSGEVLATKSAPTLAGGPPADAAPLVESMQPSAPQPEPAVSAAEYAVSAHSLGASDSTPRTLRAESRKSNASVAGFTDDQDPKHRKPRGRGNGRGRS